MEKAKILGKLKGLIASAKEMSRNSRKYTEQFWDNIFNSELFIEGLKNKVYFGELWHPDSDEEYGQIHPGDRAAVVLTDVEKRGLDYYGVFEILPTKAGKVLKNLYDIGCKLGVSSRGYADKDRTIFDEYTDYEFITFDLVAFPGVKSARLNLIGEVAESFFHERINKTKIMESLNQSVENGEYSDFIREAVSHIAKESFNKDLPTENIIDSYPALFKDSEDKNSPDSDIKDNLIIFDRRGIPHHKNKLVCDLTAESIGAEPGDRYFADAIYWSHKRNAYVTIGGFTELQE